MNGNHNRRLTILFVMIAFIFGFDQWTKFWAVDKLMGQSDIVFLDGMIRLMYAENTGAWGSLGANWPEPLKLIVMTLLPLCVLAWVGWRMIKDKTLPANEALAYGLIISGGVGNIIDRIRLGYVVDFLWMGAGPLTTNIFNIADVAIVAAMALLIIEAFRAHKEKKRQQEEAESAPIDLVR